MGSTRLPGKVLKDVCGQPMLSRVINRVRRAKLPSKIIVATTTEAADSTVAELCAAQSIDAFRGSELDVLDRYYQAALVSGAEAVMRVTADCPLIDPQVLDRLISVFEESKPDYASTTLVRTFPHGIDAEVMTMEALTLAWREASKPYERVHVTPYLYLNQDRFRCVNVACEADYSRLRWTVDTAEDLELIRNIYSRLGPGDSFGWRDVLAVFEREPALADINRGISQKRLEEC